MPPAFVLSQDQTLRKKNFLSEIPIQAFLIIEITLNQNFQGLHRTIQFSISPPLSRGNEFLIYHRPRFFQIVFRSFFELFFHQPASPARLREACLGRKTSFNIAPEKIFASAFSPFFTLFHNFFRADGRQSPARMRQRSPGRNATGPSSRRRHLFLTRGALYYYMYGNQTARTRETPSRIGSNEQREEI